MGGRPICAACGCIEDDDGCGCDSRPAVADYPDDIHELIGWMRESDKHGRYEPGLLTHAADKLDLLKRDQRDWRKGVELIAAYLGESDPPDLCCVRIARIGLELRAEVERMRASNDSFEQASEVAIADADRAERERDALKAEVDRLRESRREALELLAQLAEKIGSPSLAQMARKARELGV
jgi:hypothetical protein